MLRKVNVGSTAVGFIDGMSEYELGPYREDVEMGKAEVDSRLAIGAANDKGEKAYRFEVEREVDQIKELEEERRVAEAAKKIADEAKRAETEAEERKKAEQRRRARAAEQQKKKGSPLGVFYEYY
jgi:hypothetical protein